MSNSKQDNEWSFYHSLQMDGLIQDSRDKYWLLKPGKTQWGDQSHEPEWYGMKVNNILPALVTQLFRDSATNNDRPSF